jgi:hypothetical protein
LCAPGLLVRRCFFTPQLSVHVLRGG